MFWFIMHTRHQLNSDTEVQRLFDLLFDIGSPLTPQYFSRSEPVRTPFIKDSPKEALKMLGGGSKRKRGSIFLKGDDHNWLSQIRWHSTKCLSWQFFFSKSYLKEAANCVQFIEIVSRLAKEFPPVFGGAAPKEDWDAKHWAKIQSPGGAIGIRKMGFDLKEGLTGFYWLTLLGQDIVEYFGEDQISGLPVHQDIDLGPGGKLLVLRPSPFEPPLEQRLAMDRDLVTQLGAEYFFDINDPERPLTAIPNITT